MLSENFNLHPLEVRQEKSSYFLQTTRFSSALFCAQTKHIQGLNYLNCPNMYPWYGVEMDQHPTPIPPFWFPTWMTP